MKVMIKTLLCFLLWHTATPCAQLEGQSNQTPLITIYQQELYSNSKELDAKLAQAARQGIFYLEIPQESLTLISSAVHFAHTFYKDTQLKSLDLPDFSGYVDRENMQTENFYCEQGLWQTLYPKPVQQLAHDMQAVSTRILQKTLPLVVPQLPTSDKDKATGGLYTHNGMHHLTFKHYQTEKKVIGLLPHKDYSYITILFIDKKGLYAKLDGQWHPIPPKEGYFIVHFGLAFELLVNNPERLSACWHYVEQITQEKHNGDRINFALFADNQLHSPLYRISPDGKLEELFANYKEYLDTMFKHQALEAAAFDLDSLMN